MFEKEESQRERRERWAKMLTAHHTSAILALAETPPNYDKAELAITKARATLALLENRRDRVPPAVLLAKEVVDGLTMGNGCHTGRLAKGGWVWHNRAVYVTPDVADAAFTLLGKEPIADPLFKDSTGDDNGTD